MCEQSLCPSFNTKYQFAEKLIEKVKALKIGLGTEEGVNIGPLINENAIEKVESHLLDAVNAGAEIMCGGKRYNGDLKGYFYEPTVIKNVTNDMLIMNEETFGPVMPLQPFDDENEVVALANDTDYGLAAYIFTENLDCSLRVMEKLEYGIVGVNDVFPATAEAPFGGIKQSGVGKEGGHHGISEFVEMKYVSIGMKN